MLYLLQHDDKTHHGSNGLPAATYNQLSRSDITILTQILNHAPASSDSIFSHSYEEIVRSQVAKLPHHLRNKLPWLSTSCSLHNKILSLPMISLLKALQYEVDQGAAEVWVPLQDSGSLTQEQKVMLTALEDLSTLWTRPVSKCACCTLAKIGGNEKAMIALGASFIGRSDPRIWKKSRRILWMESWIRNSIEDEKSEDAVIKMWTLGSELRKVRKENGGTDRGYIDRFVEEARTDADKTSETHQSNAEIQSQNIELNAYLKAEDVFDDRHALDADGDGHALNMNHAWLGDEQRLPYTASSCYSRSPGDERIVWNGPP